MSDSWQCPGCNTYTSGNFCSSCGTAQPEEMKVPTIGESLDKGVFRIVFEPVEEEFDCEDEVNDAARHSCWNEDSTFDGYTVEKVRSTVTPETHPYICGACRDVVAEHTEGRCVDCNKQQWERREDTGGCEG